MTTHALPASTQKEPMKTIAVSGQSIQQLDAEGFDWEQNGFAPIFDRETGVVSEWIRSPNPDPEDVRQMNAIYRGLFPGGALAATASGEAP